MKYKLNTGFSKVPAQLVGTTLDAMYQKHGKVDPKTLIDESRDPKSALHPAFEWDDVIAAEHYRLSQARTLIRAVHIEKDGQDVGAAFVHVTINTEDGTDSGYVPIDVVVNSVALFASAVSKLKRQLDGVKDSLENLFKYKESKEHEDEIGDVMDQLGKTSKALSEIKS